MFFWSLVVAERWATRPSEVTAARGAPPPGAAIRAATAD